MARVYFITTIRQGNRKAGENGLVYPDVYDAREVDDNKAGPLIYEGGVGRGEGRENPHVSADKVVLTEIFANLLDNALKHNQATTTITSEVAHKGGKLIVTISDNGSGIPPEILDSIFGESNQKYVPGQNLGTGVGMYLSKLLTELHDGELTVQSTPEDGTKFTITLPVRRSN